MLTTNQLIQLFDEQNVIFGQKDHSLSENSISLAKDLIKHGTLPEFAFLYLDEDYTLKDLNLALKTHFQLNERITSRELPVTVAMGKYIGKESALHEWVSYSPLFQSMIHESLLPKSPLLRSTLSE